MARLCDRSRHRRSLDPSEGRILGPPLRGIELIERTFDSLGAGKGKAPSQLVARKLHTCGVFRALAQCLPDGPEIRASLWSLKCR